MLSAPFDMNKELSDVLWYAFHSSVHEYKVSSDNHGIDIFPFF